MKERKGLRIRFPNLFPEGISVFGQIMKEADKKIEAKRQAEIESRAMIQERLDELKPKTQPTEEITRE